jgi:hypothetical protein
MSRVIEGGYLKFKARFHIGHPMHGDGRQVVRIEVSDNDSRLRVLTLEAPLEAFARALFARAENEAVGELLHDAANVGRYLAHKTEVVEFPDHGLYSREKALPMVREALEPYEVAGWEARTDDAFNHHNWRGTTERDGQTYRRVAVMFYRYQDEPMATA